MFRKKLKTGIAFFAVVLFCILWRSLSYNQSSRYYSAIIFFGFFLSAYAVNHFICALKNKFIQSGFIVILLFSLLFFQLGKCFFSFRNLYVKDLQDKVNTIWDQEPGNDIVIYRNEFMRLQNNSNIFNSNLDVLLPERYNITDIYIDKASFGHSLYLIVSSDYLLLSDNKPKTEYPQFPTIKHSEIEHFLSNEKHTKSVSVFKHLSYTPSPAINADPTFDSAILKAFIPEYDTFIYQKDNKMLWLIGAEIDSKTEMIFHLYTDQPELLPERRRIYKFDNLGFRINEKGGDKSIGHYRFFEKPIPSNYHITNVIVGFSGNGKKITRVVSL